MILEAWRGQPFSFLTRLSSFSDAFPRDPGGPGQLLVEIGGPMDPWLFISPKSGTSGYPSGAKGRRQFSAQKYVAHRREWASNPPPHGRESDALSTAPRGRQMRNWPFRSVSDMPLAWLRLFFLTRISPSCRCSQRLSEGTKRIQLWRAPAPAVTEPAARLQLGHTIELYIYTGYYIYIRSLVNTLLKGGDGWPGPGWMGDQEDRLS